MRVAAVSPRLRCVWRKRKTFMAFGCKMRLVVARYNESLDWISEVPKDWTVWVYDKGDVGDRIPDVHRIKRPNIGREAETFCYHNATVPPHREWTVFLQGNPFDHFPDPIGHAQRIADRMDRVGWLGFHYSTDWNHHPHTMEDLGVARVREALSISGDCPGRISFPAGAQMVVHSSAIEKRHRSWWANAAEVSASQDWRVAHCFERLWPEIYQ